MTNWARSIYNMFADFGDWLSEKSGKRDNAIILAVLSIISPLNLFFSLGFVASSNRKKRAGKR